MNNTDRLRATNPPEFRLTKYYADCVSEAGDTVIAYYGWVQWKRLTVHYSSLLTKIGNAPARTKYSIRKSEEPLSSGASFRWHSRNLHFEGQWKAVDGPHSETLFSSDDGGIEWHCLQPRANVEIRLGSHQTIRGFGYLERLEMTIAPWKLPIDELLWGRFLSDTTSLVWIDWRGPQNRRVLLYNGEKIDAGEIPESGIAASSGGKLSFSGSVVLREGKLGTVALAALSAIKSSLPSRILNVEEHKWRSRGHWLSSQPSEGWAIHEVVKWPR